MDYVAGQYSGNDARQRDNISTNHNTTTVMLKVSLAGFHGFCTCFLCDSRIQRPQGPFTLFSTKMYGANAYQPRYGLRAGSAEDAEEALREEELWKESAWPPRNAPAFDLLNSFMERWVTASSGVGLGYSAVWCGTGL